MANVTILLKENSQHEILKGQIRFLSLNTVEINVYSDNPGDDPANLIKPEIRFTESLNFSSPFTSFNVHESYELDSNIRD